MITSKTTYEITFNGFYKKPTVLDSAITKLLSIFNNDEERIALFLNEALKNLHEQKFKEVLQDTADSMVIDQLRKIDPLLGKNDLLVGLDEDLPF